MRIAHIGIDAGTANENFMNESVSRRGGAWLLDDHGDEQAATQAKKQTLARH